MHTANPANIPWYRKVKFWHLLIYASLMAVVTVTGIFEYRSRYWDIIELYQDYAHASVTAITHSGGPESQSVDELEQILLEMLAIEGIVYISLDNEGTSPVVVSNLIPYKSIATSQRQLLQENLYLVKAGGYLLIEVNDYIVRPSGAGTIRVGFSMLPIDNLKSNVINQIIWRTGLITITMVVAFFFLISRQNTVLLMAEKKRIEQDVARLEKLNRIQEKQAAVGTLAAGLAHEIRNPINTIGILAQRLKRDFKATELESKMAKISGTMISEINRLNSTIEEFLNYSRPTPLKFAEFEFERLLDDIRLLFRDLASQSGVELLIPGGNGIILEGDGEYLKQAFNNIIRNAIEASAAGGKVEMKVTSSSSGLEIDISDEGTGIESGELNRIFDIFYTTKENGNGIGLAVTHKIISDHRGNIEVNSKAGHGTTFKVFLPRRQT